MKKYLLIFLLSLSLSAVAQKKLNEGVITMKTLMSSDNEQLNSQLAMLGDMITTIHFKGNKSKSELNNPMAGQTITIVDGDTGQMLLLMNNPMAGKKYSKTEFNLTEEDLKNISITENGKSKTLLNYECKGFDIVVKKNEKETKMVMYLTDKITAPTQNNALLGNKLKGYPLYMLWHVKQMGAEMIMTMEVTQIREEVVDGKIFEMIIPEGYEKLGGSAPATVD